AQTNRLFSPQRDSGSGHALESSATRTACPAADPDERVLAAGCPGGLRAARHRWARRQAIGRRRGLVRGSYGEKRNGSRSLTFNAGAAGRGWRKGVRAAKHDSEVTEDGANHFRRIALGVEGVRQDRDCDGNGELLRG